MPQNICSLKHFGDNVAQHEIFATTRESSHCAKVARLVVGRLQNSTVGRTIQFPGEIVRREHHHHHLLGLVFVVPLQEMLLFISPSSATVTHGIHPGCQWLVLKMLGGAVQMLLEVLPRLAGIHPYQRRSLNKFNRSADRHAAVSSFIPRRWMSSVSLHQLS